MNNEQPLIKVILADDHTLVRAGIRSLLEKSPEISVVAEANEGRELLEMLKTHEADLVLMDIAMPGLNGLEATARISREFPKVRVIMLSMHQNEEYFWQALKAGASGYLLKKAATVELEAAVIQVMAGETYLSREIAVRLSKRMPLNQLARAKSPLESLTERQREILQLIAEGETTKAIALLLKLSPKTVEYHRAELMSRLGIFDVPGLVRFAMQVGLINKET
jgi:DNA-binding NarL/FixJ family response regulator